MKHVSSSDGVRAIHELARFRTLVALGFDGALAPIVANRGEARMGMRTAWLLRRVARRYPTAVISGRCLADVGARLGGAPVAHVVGNHGLEPFSTDVSAQRDIAEARSILARGLSRLPGIEVEDKQFSLTLHYRRAGSKDIARSAIRRSIRALDIPLRARSGQDAIDVLPVDAPRTSDVLHALCDATGADYVLHLECDDADASMPGHVSLSIGSKKRVARVMVTERRQVDELLFALVRARLLAGRA